MAELTTRGRTWLLLAIFAALATFHTWPMPSDPAHLTRLDNNDTAFNTWVIAWVAHQVVRDPLNLFEAPIFYPAHSALAFSEHLVVQGVMSAPLQWLGASPVLAYNAMVWLGLTLSGFATAYVIRSWTSSTPAGIVAGCLYAFNAHLLTRYAHLQALHLEFFPIVLYAFDRVLRRAHLKDAMLLAAAFALQALCSYYTMVMMAAGLVVAFVVRDEPWRANRRMWLMLVMAGTVAMLALLPFLLPYSRVREEQGLVRTSDDLLVYSATWRDYLATGARLHYDAWSHRFFDGRAALFPGVVGMLLSFTAVATGIAWKDSRARMTLAIGALGLALSFGTAVPGYAWLQENVAVIQGIRAVSRWGLLFLIAVAILSGFAVAHLESRWSKRRWWAAAVWMIVALITLEAARVPLAMQRHDGIPRVHDRLALEDIRAMVVFPLYGGNEFNQNAQYLLHQTRHWRPMLNAYSSFAPPMFYELAEKLQSFPDGTSLQLLRANGFSHVLLHRAPLERDYGTAAVDALRTHPDLQLVFEEDGVILYRLH